MFSIFVIHKTEDNLPLLTIQMLSEPDFSHPIKVDYDELFYKGINCSNI